MKNKVTLIIFLLLIILIIIATTIGIKIGGFQILSVSQLKQKNQELNQKIDTATTLTSVDYPNNINTLEETYERYTITKQKYETISGFTDDEQKQFFETKQYDIGYLWKTVGKYATSLNLTIGMDVKQSGVPNSYDLYFNVSGQYVNISQFIADIENNSNLFFRIYNFKMSGNSDIVSSSFTVKNVNIDPSTLITTSTTQLTNSETIQQK